MALGGGVYSSQNKRLGGSYINFQSNEERSVNLITKAINANGTYLASDDDADGYLSVIVEVAPNVDSKEIAENGTYNASDEGLDGYDSVTVNVSSAGTILSGQDFTTQAAGAGSISFYGTDTETLPSILPATNGIDTSLVTNEALKMYLGTPIGIGCSLEIEFGSISVSNSISSAISFLQSSDYGLWEYGITASGDIVNSITSDTVGNIADLANNTLKITCNYVNNTSGVLNIEYKVYIGDTLIDTMGGDLGGNGVNAIVGLLFPEVGTDALNAQIKSIYVKAE